MPRFVEGSITIRITLQCAICAVLRIGGGPCDLQHFENTGADQSGHPRHLHIVYAGHCAPEREDLLRAFGVVGCSQGQLRMECVKSHSGAGTTNFCWSCRHSGSASGDARPPSVPRIEYRPFLPRNSESAQRMSDIAVTDCGVWKSEAGSTVWLGAGAAALAGSAASLRFGWSSELRYQLQVLEHARGAVWVVEPLRMR